MRLNACSMIALILFQIVENHHQCDALDFWDKAKSAVAGFIKKVKNFLTGNSDGNGQETSAGTSNEMENSTSSMTPNPENRELEGELQWLIEHNETGVPFLRYVFDGCSAQNESGDGGMSSDNSLISSATSRGILTIQIEVDVNRRFSMNMSECSKDDNWAVCPEGGIPLSSNMTECKVISPIRKRCSPPKYGLFSINATQYIEITIAVNDSQIKSCKGNLTFIVPDESVSTPEVINYTTSTTRNALDDSTSFQKDPDSSHDDFVIIIASVPAAVIIIIIGLVSIIIWKRREKCFGGSKIDNETALAHYNTNNDGRDDSPGSVAHVVTQIGNNVTLESPVYTLQDDQVMPAGNSEYHSNNDNTSNSGGLPSGATFSPVEEGCTYSKLHEPIRNFSDTYNVVVKTPRETEKMAQETMGASCLTTAQGTTYSTFNEKPRNISDTYDVMVKEPDKAQMTPPNTTASVIPEQTCPPNEETEGDIYCNQSTGNTPAADVYSHLGEQVRQPRYGYDEWPIPGSRSHVASNISPQDTGTPADENPEDHYGNVGQ